MEKEAGSEYGGFMSPFGNPFVQDIWLLFPRTPLAQSLLKPSIALLVKAH